MKMVKRLLLGSAAGLVAVSAGQAADLPVKAKPVEYVKICTLYGAGFYYMPGTDICLKIGGYARAETTYHSNGNFAGGPTAQDFNNRYTNEFVMRARAYITADAREQTAWGTARAYVAVGVATTDTGATVAPSILGFNRAFIQWAGITAGITQSFFDFYSSAAVGYRAYNPSEDTGDAGWWVWAYTAQLGNGLSASISAEQRRTSQIINAVTNATFCGTLTNALVNTGCYGGIQVPDIVGNIRLDQTWGSAQVMAVAHEVNPQYYGTPPFSGHPGDKWGFVVAAGLRLNFPNIAQGDFFQAEVNYTQGALRYLEHGNNSPNYFINRGNNFGFGVTSDCVFGAQVNGTTDTASTGTTGCNLTTAWSVNASYEHYWTPQFHESFVGSYLATRYNAQANALLCLSEGDATGGGGVNAVANAGCNNNFDIWSAATRLQYDFTKTLYIGVEFLYQHLDTATLSGNTTHTSGFIPGSGTTSLITDSGQNQIKNQNNLAVTLRMHKDFLP